jgi:ABC-2 type transport system permease protein
MSATTETVRRQASAAGAGRVFAAVLWRDIFVTGRELPAFLAQVILQPFFLLFVFGRVLGDLGYVSGGYANLLLPGVIGLTTVLTALQSTAFPLVIDFSFTKEIEDRLLAPLPTSLVAVEKVVFSMIRALIAAILMFPIGALVLGSVPFRASGLPLLVAALLLGSLVGAAMGLTIGTLVQPARINIVFALVLTPLLFTGCSQYPWPTLDRLPWFQVITLFNPLTYASEAMRAAMVPSVPHIAPWISIVVLVAASAGFLVIGIRGFLRRAID